MWAFVLVLSLGISFSFADIQNHPKQVSIEGLYQVTGIGEQEWWAFRPYDPITRGEAAQWIVQAFKLAKIYPLHLPFVVDKQLTYTNPLAIIDESYVVPTYTDTRFHPLEPYIEGLAKVRVIPVVEDQYHPDRPMTGQEFVTIVVNTIFGVDCDCDEEEMWEILDLMGFAGLDLWECDEIITRGEAAHVLFSIVGDPWFKTVTVLVTADIHGHLEPYKPRGSDYYIGGMAKMARFVNEMRAVQPNLLLLDVGDAPYNTNVANLFEGEPVIRLMNLMGYDAMAIGNHDFDFPFNVMERNAALADFPFLSANTYYHGEFPVFLDPYVILEVEGIRFGIIGVTDDSSAWYTHPRNVIGITFEDHYEATIRVVEEIQDDVDIILILAHLHGHNARLPHRLGWPVYMVLGGGEDKVELPTLINDIWLIASGKHAELVSQIHINFWQEVPLGFNFGHVFMSENLPVDPVADLLIRKYVSHMDDVLEHVVGYTHVFLEGDRGVVRLSESNLGNLIADSLREVTGADLAIQNGGGIRASINPGEITIKDIYTVLPFDNIVVVLEVTGQTVWDTLEHGVSWWPGAGGGFLQVSGMEYVFDPNQPVGKRIQSVTVDGKPIDLDQKYMMAANDFLSGGGDMFTMLAEAREVIRTRSYLRDIFWEYLQMFDAVSPDLEGRITILNQD